MSGNSGGGVNLLADDDTQAELRRLARELADRELAPRAAGWDEREQFPDHSWEVLRKADLLGITVGHKYGGGGLGDREATVVLEELARADVSSAIICQLVYNGPGRAVQHLGNDEMRERWLPRAARGEALFCIGITEPEAGSAVQNMRSKLVPDGSGFRLTGYKNYVTGGHHAQACLVWCRFPDAPVPGIGAVLVALDSPGVSVAGIHRKMGLRGMAEAELAFDDVRVEAADVLVDGRDSHGLRTLLAHLNHERCGNAAMCVGAAQGALESARDYVRQRFLGATRLADYQGLQWKIADMTTELEAARLLLYRAVSLAGPHGTPPAMETAMAKMKANLVAKFVCDEAIQLLGGYGFSREYPLERIYRDIRGLCIGAGTVEVQRNYVGGRVTNGSIPHSPGWRS